MAAGDVKRTTGEPHDRLTRLCAVMTDALEANEEYQGERCIVMLWGDDGGGIQTHGYTSDSDAIADMLVHLQAIFAASGKQLLFAPLNQG